jgi:hypothetical protein
MNGTTQLQGKVMVVHQKYIKDAPLSWKVRNSLRPAFIWGWITTRAAIALTKITGIPTIISELRAVKIDSMGQRTDYGVVSRRVVTDNGVGFIVDAWQNSVELEIMKYHGCGTGTTAEAAGDTGLVTESTTALNPDSTRATGTLAEGASANIFQTVGTLTFDNTAAVTEHGLFSQSGTGSGVLFDRSVFTAVNVVSGDSIQFTYSVTFTSGG